MKMEILVNVTIHKSQIGQSFLLTPADGTYDPVFGIGWGLAGVCPGPALVGIADGLPQAWVFMAATVAGMGLYALFNRLLAK